MEKRVLNLKEIKKAYTRGFGERKRCDYNLKSKGKLFKKSNTFKRQEKTALC